MRQIGYLEDEQQARRFSDYLLTEGVTCKVESGGDCWTLWIHDERDVDRGREELKQFQESPDDPRYTSAADDAVKLRRQEAKREKEHAKNVVQMRTRWRSASVSGRMPVTIALIVISVLVTFATNFGKDIRKANWVSFEPYVQVEGRWVWYPNRGLTAIPDGEIWRVVSPIFMHLSWLHILMNMYWTYQFGRIMEWSRGSIRLLIFVVAVAVISNFAQYWWKDPFFGGMSGVGYGQFGYLWMKSKYDPSAGIRLPPNLVFIFLLWLVICMTGLVGPIANAAHFIGLVAGMAIGYLPVILGRRF
jgi:GlpG protein